MAHCEKPAFLLLKLPTSHNDLHHAGGPQDPNPHLGRPLHSGHRNGSIRSHILKQQSARLKECHWHG